MVCPTINHHINPSCLNKCWIPSDNPIMWFTQSILFALLIPFTRVLALGGPQCLSFSRTRYTISGSRTPATIVIDSSDWPGVHRAAIDLQNDLEKVTGIRPIVLNLTLSSNTDSFRTANSVTNTPIIIGTLGKSSLVNLLKQSNRKLSSKLSTIEGKWEASVSEVVSPPVLGFTAAYAIIGSDKRGTIYGIYDFLEQAGVSPW